MGGKGAFRFGKVGGVVGGGNDDDDGVGVVVDEDGTVDEEEEDDVASSGRISARINCASIVAAVQQQKPVRDGGER